MYVGRDIFVCKQSIYLGVMLTVLTFICDNLHLNKCDDICYKKFDHF